MEYFDLFNLTPVTRALNLRHFEKHFNQVLQSNLHGKTRHLVFSFLVCILTKSNKLSKVSQDGKSKHKTEITGKIWDCLSSNNGLFK